MGTRTFQGIKSGRGVTLTPHPSSTEVKKESRAISLLSLTAFVACKKGEKLINLELSRHISEKYSNTNFLKIRPAGAEFFHADGQTDMTNVSHFSLFSEHAEERSSGCSNVQSADGN
jgi:hypothetical protein